MTEDRDAIVTIEGDPTTAEQVVITASLWSIADDGTKTNKNGLEPSAMADSTLPKLNDTPKSNSRRQLKYNRLCPYCDRQYDSTYRLDDRRQITTAEEGSSKICFDPTTGRVYIHGPE